MVIRQSERVTTPLGYGRDTQPLPTVEARPYLPNWKVTGGDSVPTEGLIYSVAAGGRIVDRHDVLTQSRSLLPQYTGPFFQDMDTEPLDTSERDTTQVIPIQVVRSLVEETLEKKRTQEAKSRERKLLADEESQRINTLFSHFYELAERRTRLTFLQDFKQAVHSFFLWSPIAQITTDIKYFDIEQRLLKNSRKKSRRGENNLVCLVR